MTFRVIIQPPAAQELEEAFLWIAERHPEAAAAWFDRLQAAIESLAQFPERCPLAPENGVFAEEIRQLLVGRRSAVYRVLFTVRRDAVHVLHVRHGARERLRSADGKDA